MTSAPRVPATPSKASLLMPLIGLMAWMSGGFFWGTAQAQSQPVFIPLGALERVQGEATVWRGETAIPAKIGGEITRGDTLSTAADSRLLVTFTDGTQLTLGERAEAFIEYYVYNPIKKKGAAFVEVVKGAFRFTSGRMRDLNDKRIEVRAGSATFAADGSDFWGGPMDDAYAFLLLSGRIEVRNESGMVILQKKRLGSTIAKPGQAPDVPEHWNKDRVNQAVSTIAFK